MPVPLAAGPRRAARFAVAVLLLSTLAAPADDWPQWLGPRRDGSTPERLDRATWPLVSAWQQQVGLGSAPVVVAAKRVFVAGNAGPLEERVDQLLCLDAGSGRELWRQEYPCRAGTPPGPLASPAVDGDLVYFLSREGRLSCLLAASGKIVWEKDLRQEFGGHPAILGYAAPPLVVEALLLVQTGGAKGSLAAFNKVTGRVVWQSGDDRIGYASPALGSLNKVATAVEFAANAVRGVDPASGQTLWRYPLYVPCQDAACTPVATGSRVVVSAARGVGTLVLDLDGSTPKLAWRSDELAAPRGNLILRHGCLYGFSGSDDAPAWQQTLVCLDLATGKLAWRESGRPGGLLLAGDQLLVLRDSGSLVLAPADRQGLRPSASMKLPEGRYLAPPVFANQQLFVRNDKGLLYCLVSDVPRDKEP